MMYYNRDDWRGRANMKVRIKLVEMMTCQVIPVSKVILRYARIPVPIATTGVFTWDRDELRPVWNFYNRSHETGTKCLVPGFETKWHVLSNKYVTDPKAYRLEISGPGLRFVVIYMRTVRTQTGTRISHLGPATETKSDRSEFIIRPLSCKCIKENVWRSIRTHAGLSSSRSHVNTP